MTARTCKATAKSTGERCQQPVNRDATVCRFHGGASPGARKAARERATNRRAKAELARLGELKVDIHPAEALIQLVQWTAGEVAYWRQRVTQITDDDLVWGTTKTKQGGDDHGTTQEAKPHIAYVMLERSSDRLASYAAAALKAGVEERRIALAESQGQAVAGVIRRILTALNLTETQQLLVGEVVPRELRALTQEGQHP